MKFKDLKIGMKVEDRWYPEWGVGTVLKVLKTRAHILFERVNSERYSYDKAHVQFLEEDGYSDKRNKN
jgi:hypothetical protein